MLRQLLSQRAEYLTDFLNFTTNATKRENVLRILGLAQRLQTLMWKSHPNFQSEKVRQADFARGVLEKELNAELQRYRFRSAVSAMYHFQIQWLAVASRKQPKSEIRAWKQASKTPVTELVAVQIVLEIASHKQLHRVRECEAPNNKHRNRLCGNWFFATNNKRLVCTDNCRVRKAQGTNEFRQKRREYMRKYNDPSSRRLRRMKMRDSNS